MLQNVIFSYRLINTHASKKKGFIENANLIMNKISYYTGQLNFQ